MADENSAASIEPKDKLKASNYLNRFDSAVLYGIAGAVISGIAASIGFMPVSIGALPMNMAVGSALFIAEWVRGIGGN